MALSTFGPGALIRDSRIRLCLTQAELASKIGVTAGFITKLERDETSAGYERLAGIAAALGLDVEVLLRASAALREQRAMDRTRARGSMRFSDGMADSAAMPTPDQAAQMAQEIIADPVLRSAWGFLRTALADPEMRPVALKTLQALALQSRS